MDYLDLEEERLKYDPQEEEELFNCDKCGAEIYEGQEYYECEMGDLCEKCFDKMQEDEKSECERIAGDEDEY